MKPLSEITAIVVDNGMFVELARKLAQTYKTVYYNCANKCAFRKMNLSRIGYGYPEIEVIDTMWPDNFDEIDLFVFPDIGFPFEQTYLESIGKKVWGARKGEQLEQEREITKELLADIGLPVGEYDEIHGVDALREYLKTHKEVFVKMSEWRGTFESFYSPEYKLVEPKLDEVEFNLGAFKYISDFCVENALPDRVELGVDMYTVNGKYPGRCLQGIEIKDKGYIGAIKPYSDFPAPLREVNEKLSPTFKEYGYAGFFSTEVRIGKDMKPYLIDFTAREGSPPGELYQEMYKNISDIIWQGANGICIDPEPAGKYGVQINIHSPWAEWNWQPIDFPKENRSFIKLHNCTFIKGKHYVIPMEYGLDKIGSVIGYGDTLDEARKKAKEVGESIEGYYIEVMGDSLDDAEKEIEKAEKMGMKVL